MRIRRNRGQRSHGLVRTYVWLMVLCVVASVTAAAMLATSRTGYEAHASVVIRPTITASGSILGAAMPTELEVAQSGFVVRQAAARLDISSKDAQESVAVEVPVDAAVLDFTYTADTARDAFLGAKAFSETYAEYRNKGEARPVARLITPASLPDEPVAPDYALIIGVAALGGLALGFAAALAWDRLAGRLRTAEDAGVCTDLPVLASLPHMSRWGGRSALAADSQMTMAFAQLASRVPGLVESRKEFTVLMTGATSHAGTSTIARQTAVALARMGKPVVLVGADPDSTALEECFGIPRSPGLSDLLAGHAVPETALHKTAVPGLRVLPAGSDKRGSSGPQSLDDLQLLIWSLAADSIVIIDAPAVLSSAHAALLGYVADRLVLVVDLAHGSRSSAREAAASLTHVAEKVAGCVTNQPERVRKRSATARHLRMQPAIEMVAPTS